MWKSTPCRNVAGSLVLKAKCTMLFCFVSMFNVFCIKQCTNVPVSPGLSTTNKGFSSKKEIFPSQAFKAFYSQKGKIKGKWDVKEPTCVESRELTHSMDFRS